jgi:hypothetical protein
MWTPASIIVGAVLIAAAMLVVNHWQLQVIDTASALRLNRLDWRRRAMPSRRQHWRYAPGRASLIIKRGVDEEKPVDTSDD